jgi:3-beta hydroxysteroid dehydrogenase/isomerase family
MKIEVGWCPSNRTLPRPHFQIGNTNLFDWTYIRNVTYAHILAANKLVPQPPSTPDVIGSLWLCLLHGTLAFHLRRCNPLNLRRHPVRVLIPSFCPFPTYPLPILIIDPSFSQMTKCGCKTQRRMRSSTCWEPLLSVLQLCSTRTGMNLH